VTDRPETGVMQFGDDWPGVFIRGDQAGWMAAALGEMLTGVTPNVLVTAQLWEMYQLLMDSNAQNSITEDLQQLRPYPECVKETPRE
jgi:hypothetical protein